MLRNRGGAESRCARAGVRRAARTGESVCSLAGLHTHNHGTRAVRTNIFIDDKLIAEAMKLSGARTKREAVESSLRLLVRVKRQERIRRARGKLEWTGDLDAMRRD